MFSNHNYAKPVTKFLIGYGSYGDNIPRCKRFIEKMQELGVTDKKLAVGDFINTEGTLLTATLLENVTADSAIRYYKLYYNGKKICETRQKDSSYESYIYMFPHFSPLGSVKSLKATAEEPVSIARPKG